MNTSGVRGEEKGKFEFVRDKLLLKIFNANLFDKYCEKIAKFFNLFSINFKEKQAFRFVK